VGALRKLLLAKYENAFLAFKAEFDHFAIGVGHDAGVRRLGVAIFPATVGLGHHVAAFRNGEMIAVDLETVFAGLQIGLPNLRGMREGKRGRHRLGVERYGDGECATKSEVRQERSGFHEVILSTIESTGSMWRGRTVDTLSGEE